ncbi:MAG: amidohydrolase family protein [Pseudomonadota bacterium]|nr:amidohydrolase family protein [Pseudomonadota bacterium]
MLSDMSGIPCLPPPRTEQPARLEVPDGAWDCHFHVIGDPAEYPHHPQRSYDPYPVTPDDFINVMDTAGIAYGLAIQISIHGFDNRYMEAALRQYPGRLKGVAVIDPRAPDAELDRLRSLGVVGARILDAQSGVSMQDLETLDARCAEIGWSLQLCLPARSFHEHRARLARLRSTLVIDHLGMPDVTDGVDGSDFQSLLGLMAETGAWMKLGAFRHSLEQAPYRDMWRFIETVVARQADRLIWGSDWPFVRITDPSKMPQYADLLDLLALLDWDTPLTKAILADNPSRLFGRPAASA